MSTKLAIAALALGLLSFVHLFGVDKAVFAVVLGAVALRDPQLTLTGRRLAKAAVAAGLLYTFWITAVLLRHMPALNEAASKLAQ